MSGHECRRLTTPWFATNTPRTFAARSRATEGTFELPATSLGDHLVRDRARRCSGQLRRGGRAAVQRALDQRRRRSRRPLRRPGRSSAHVPVTLSGGPPTRRRAGRARRHGRPAGASDDRARPLRNWKRTAVRSPSRPSSSRPLSPSTSPAEPGSRRRQRLVEDYEALERLLADAPHWLIQPYIQGVLTAVAGVAWRGEVVCSAHQAARRIYPPLLGVSAYAETLTVDPALDRALAEILRRLGWSRHLRVPADPRPARDVRDRPEPKAVRFASAGDRSGPQPAGDLDRPAPRPTAQDRPVPCRHPLPRRGAGMPGARPSALARRLVDALAIVRPRPANECAFDLLEHIPCRYSSSSCAPPAGRPEPSIAQLRLLRGPARRASSAPRSSACFAAGLGFDSASSRRSSSATRRSSGSRLRTAWSARPPGRAARSLPRPPVPAGKLVGDEALPRRCPPAGEDVLLLLALGHRRENSAAGSGGSLRVDDHRRPAGSRRRAA